MRTSASLSNIKSNVLHVWLPSANLSSFPHLRYYRTSSSDGTSAGHEGLGRPVPIT